MSQSKQRYLNYKYDTCYIQSTPDNSNLQGKSKKVRVIGSSKKIKHVNGTSKSNVSDASTVFSLHFKHSKHGSRYRG